ncbi:MAG: DUF4296 domain-containing protein [Bacteroidales bacterium]|nr:DUF4296 domain-containing protein [Bacteroidales bacterium]
MKQLLVMAMLTLSVAFGACSHGLPKGIMSEQQMVDFLSEAYLIEGFYAIETGYHYESLGEEIVSAYQQLLARQGLTQEQFEQSVSYYMHHADRYEDIHRQVVERLDAALPDEAKHQSEPVSLPIRPLSADRQP